VLPPTIAPTANATAAIAATGHARRMRSAGVDASKRSLSALNVAIEHGG
jgi:hypothetical protein